MLLVTVRFNRKNHCSPGNAAILYSKRSNIEYELPIPNTVSVTERSTNENNNASQKFKNDLCCLLKYFTTKTRFLIRDFTSSTKLRNTRKEIR